MRDYARIATKIAETPWLITPEGLTTVLSIFEEHRRGGHLSDAEITRRLEDRMIARGNGKQSDFVTYDARTEGGVGILPIAGPIFGKANLMTQLSGATSLEMTRQDFRAMMADESLHTILLNIDSPGGTSDLVREFGDEIRAARDEKNIVALANTTAGSAAYWLGSQAGTFYSTKSGMVGSVGAYTVHEDQSGADAKDGVKYTYVFAGPHKIEGNPHEALSQEGKEYRQEVINSLYEDFVSAIAEGRGTTTDAVKANYGGGRMIMPEAALEAGMIDGIVTEEALMSTLHQQPRAFSVVIGDKAVAATMEGNRLVFAGDFSNEFMQSIADKYGIQLEHADMEHSEPGTGTPPQPRQQEEKDPAIEGGWRRDPLPLDPDDPTAPKPNSKSNGGERNMDEAQLRELFHAHGLTYDESQLPQLVEAVKTDRKAVAEHSRIQTRSEEETRLQEQFPHMWEEHVANRNANRKNEASSFVDSIKQIKTPQGDGLVPTKIALSALAMETVQQTHIKFAAGEGTLEDFETAIKAITDGGTVDYSEIGSERLSGDDVEVNLTDVANVRTAFASVVDNIQKANKDWTYDMCLAEAARKHPDLANAYRTALPNA